MEALVASLEEIGDLVGSGQASVDVGFFGLCTHLLGRGEVAAFEGFELGVGIGHDVGDVLDVGALGHQLEQFGLVDDFLTGGVDEDATFVHLVHHSVVDALLGLGSGRDVQADHVAGLELTTSQVSKRASRLATA